MAVIAAPAKPPAVRTRRRIWSAVGLVVVLVLAQWVVLRWMWNAQELTAYHSSPGSQTLMRLGETDYFSEYVGPVPHAHVRDAVVDLRAVTPLVSDNSADARVEVLLCAALGGGGGDSLTDLCRSAVPFHAGTTDLEPSATQLVVAITPRREGEVRVAGLDVAYRDGIRRGEQHTGTEIGVLVRDRIATPPAHHVANGG